MAAFRYRVRDKATRKLHTGTLAATSRNEAVKKLRAKNYLILEVTPDRGIKLNVSIFNRVGTKDRVLFAREFAVMMKAGLPIIPAMRAIQDQTANRTLKRSLDDLINDIEGGTSLSESFSRFPGIFPPIFVSVTKVGEKSGKLEEVLERLASQLEKDSELLGKIRGAMIYPIFVLLALFIVIILIMVYIIPQLRGLFDDVNLELPAITRLLLLASDLTRRYIVVWLSLLIGGFIGLRLAAKRWPAIGLRIEKVRFRLPVFGQLYRQMLMARLCHTMGTLLGAGLPMIESIKTAGRTLDSPTYHLALNGVALKVESGQTLSASLLADKQFPAMIGHMVSIGEKSGNISELFGTVAGFFDQEVEGLTRNLSALLEPFLMLIMGLGVGLVVASVIVPIYNLVNAV